MKKSDFDPPPNDPDGTGSTDGAARSVPQAIADAYNTKTNLSLSREDIAFVGGIFAYLRYAEDSNLDEGLLRTIYGPVSELTNEVPDTVQQRCTSAISRLKAQKILVRSDFGGVFEDGHLTLSSLGNAIGNYIDQESSLTTQSLVFYLTRIRSELAKVIESINTGGDATVWESEVVAPMRYLVSDMVDAIDRRSRGLDAINQHLRKHITELFRQQWAAAIDICLELLGKVDTTIDELTAVLSEHVESLTRQLSEIAEYSDHHPAIQTLTDGLRTQLTRIHNWSLRRHDEWAGYYHLVQEHIRMFIRIDPDNRMRERIRHHIQHFSERPYALITINPVPFLHMRDVERPDKIQQVVVPDILLANREIKEITELELDAIDLVAKKLIARLELDGMIDLVAAIITDGCHLNEAEWYTLISRVTPLLLARGIPPDALRFRDWLEMSPRLSAQALTVSAETSQTGRSTPSAEAPHTNEGHQDGH